MDDWFTEYGCYHIADAQYASEREFVETIEGLANATQCFLECDYRDDQALEATGKHGCNVAAYYPSSGNCETFYVSQENWEAGEIKVVTPQDDEHWTLVTKVFCRDAWCATSIAVHARYS